MRNLKRALSLAMASVMLLGMMVVGTGASYADVDASKNVEAIEVLQAVGVMSGDDRGNFNPDNEVSRNEMAVIMVNLLGLTPGGTTNFKDVPTWAQPFVAACYSNGIIAGYNDTTFGGSDTVNAVQASLMVMKALGYFQYQGEFGQNWELAVVKQAQKIGLYEGIDAYVTKTMNRNEVAQMVLNALETTIAVVTEQGGMNVSGDGFEVNQKPTYTYASAANTTGFDYAGKTGTAGATMELCEKLYGDSLRKAGNTKDDMNRPSTKWTYKGKTVNAPDSPDAVYTTEVAAKDVYKALNLPSSKSVDIYRNGSDATYTTVTLSSSNSTKIGGNGTVLEFYVDRNNNVQAIEYYEFLAQAAANYNTTTEKLAISVKSNLIGMPNEIKAEDFPIVANAKKDDYLLITVAYDGTKYNVQTVQAATKVADVTVSEYKNNDYLIGNGTKYNYNDYASTFVAGGNGALGYTELATGFGTGNLNSTKYDLILDSHGYVIGVTGASSVATLENYVFVKRSDNAGFQYLAEIVTMNGTIKTVEVSKVAAYNGTLTDVTSANVSNEAPANGVLAYNCFYTFNVDKNGKYELTAVDPARQDPGTALAGSVARPVTGSGAIATDSTVFIADKTVYVGVKNAPIVAAGAGVNVYALKDEDGFLMAAYTATAGASTASANDFVYVISYDGSGKDANGNTYYTYTAVVKGEKTTLKAADAGKVGGLYEVNQYINGYAKLDNLITVGTSRVTIASGTNANISFKNGTANLNGAPVVLAEDALIYTVDTTDADKPMKVLTSGDQLNALDIGSYTCYAVNVSTSDSKIAVLALIQTA